MSLRLRQFLDEHFVAVVLVCCLVTLAGGWLVITTHVHPQTAVEEDVVATWSTDGEFAHSGTVRQETAAFDAGETLENRSLYFTSITPELDGTYVYGHEGDADPASVHVDLRLVLRATDGGTDGAGEETVEHWRIDDHLAHTTATSLDPGDEVRASFSVDVREAIDRIAAIEDDLGASPGRTEVLVIADVEIETAVAGEPVVVTRSDRLAIDPGGNTYEVIETTDGEHTERVTDSEDVPVTPGRVQSVGAVVLLLGGFGGLAVTFELRRRGIVPLSASQRAVAAHERERRRFAEWISTGRVDSPSDSASSLPGEVEVPIESLEDLVDVAIDADRRVVEDATREAYYVFVEDVRYVYRPNGDVRESSCRTGETRATIKSRRKN